MFRFLFVLLFMLPIAVVSVEEYNRGECEACNWRGQCATNRCLNGKCVYWTAASEEKCFPSWKKKECEPCEKMDDCITNRCVYGKCVYWNQLSVAKCTATTKKEECEPCQLSAECKSYICFRGKCIIGGYWNSRHCFLKPECSYCKYSEECSQRKCLYGKCTSGEIDSLKKCDILPSPSVSPTPSRTPSVSPSPTRSASSSPSPSPFPKKYDCEPCKENWECKSYSCVYGKCGLHWAIWKCPRDECDRCYGDYQCKSGKCIYDKCSDGSNESLKKCGLLPSPSVTPTSLPSVTPSKSPAPKKSDCEECSYDFECSSYICTYGRCGRPYSLRRCPREECDFCRKDKQCIPGKCIGFKCTDGSYESMTKCGIQIYPSPTASPSLVPFPTPTPTRTSTPTATPSSTRSLPPSPTPSSSPPKIKLPDCEKCGRDQNCLSNICSYGICGEPRRVRFCPREECELCREDGQCKIAKCMFGRCTDGSEEGLKRCGIVPNV